MSNHYHMSIIFSGFHVILGKSPIDYKASSKGSDQANSASLTTLLHLLHHDLCSALLYNSMFWMQGP